MSESQEHRTPDDPGAHLISADDPGPDADDADGAPFAGDDDIRSGHLDEQ